MILKMIPKSELFIVVFLLYSSCLVKSAPSPIFDSFGFSPIAYGDGYHSYEYPGYGYDYRRPAHRKYRVKHYYPPIAVLAG